MVGRPRARGLGAEEGRSAVNVREERSEVIALVIIVASVCAIYIYIKN